MKVAFLKVPSKTMKLSSPQLVIAEIMLQPKRRPVARTTGVSPFRAKLVPPRWSLRKPISSPQ
ncbi:hypothetical protein BGV68_03905 [Burkholderia ubonensis]|nr:hypothetical protein BGV68_03905 [Burkholderia ubonensis]